MVKIVSKPEPLRRVDLPKADQFGEHKKMAAIQCCHFQYAFSKAGIFSKACG